ncbi:MAG: hypothetical protein ACYC8T_39245 [Myxococcaceae bacterium]
MRFSLLTAAALGLLAGCRPAPAPQVEGPQQPQVTLHGVRLRYFKGENLVASGTATGLTYTSASTGFSAADVTVTLPGRSGGGVRAPGGSLAGDLHLSAPTARGTLGNRQVDGEGGVVLRTGSGLTGKTPRAHIDGAASTASGAEEVSIDGPNYRLTSRGFAIDFPTEHFTFQSAVDSRFRSPR